MLSGKILFDLVLLTAAAAGCFEASRMTGFGQIGPGGFPMVIMGAGAGLMMLILFDDLRQARRAADGRAEPISFKQGAGMTLFILLLALYIALFEPLGFLGTTGAFLFVATLLSSWLLDPPLTRAAWRRTAAGAALFSAVTTIATYLAFTVGFGLVFP